MFSRFNCRAKEKAIFKVHSLAIVLEILPSSLITTVQYPTSTCLLRFPKNRFLLVELNPVWNGFFPFNLDLGSIWFVGVIRNNSKEFGFFLDTMRVCVWVNSSKLENKFVSLEPDQSYSFGGTQSLMHTRLREK